MDSTEPIPHTDHVHHEYTPPYVETHYDQHACCFVIFLFLGLVCLGVVALLFYFVVVVLGVEGDFVGYLTALPFCGFFFCGWKVGVSVYDCYKDSKNNGKHIVCLNAPKNRIAFVHVICSCYSKKQIMSPLSRITKFRYCNRSVWKVIITMGDGEVFGSEVVLPMFEVNQMIEILQGSNPEIVIEVDVVNNDNPANDNPAILYDADTVTSDGSVSTSVGDTSTAYPPPPSAFSTSSSSSLSLPDNNSSELHTGAENGDGSGNGNGNSSSAEMEGLEQNTSSLPPYLLPSSVLNSVSVSSTTASSSSSTPSTSSQ